MLTQDSGLLTQDSGLFTQDNGLFTQDNGLLTQDSGLLTRDSGLLTQDSGLLTQDSDLLTQDSDLLTQDSGLLTQDSGLLTQDRGCFGNIPNMLLKSSCHHFMSVKLFLYKTISTQNHITFSFSSTSLYCYSYLAYYISSKHKYLIFFKMLFRAPSLNDI